MAYGRRRGAPIKLILSLVVVGMLALVGALFWFASSAESNPPEQRDIRVEAQNVGPF